MTLSDIIFKRNEKMILWQQILIDFLGVYSTDDSPAIDNYFPNCERIFEIEFGRCYR